MERTRISMQIELAQRKQIEQRIKAEYPKLRNMSELLREALPEFLSTK